MGLQHDISRLKGSHFEASVLEAALIKGMLSRTKRNGFEQCWCENRRGS